MKSTSAGVRPRTAARFAAVQALFQIEQGQDTADSVIDQFIRHRLSLEVTASDGEACLPGADIPLFGRIVRAVWERRESLDAIVMGALPTDWPLGRLDPVLRSLLRAGCAELAMKDGPPARVVINEYLEVAHGFFSGDEAKLANGVLDRVAHLLRPDEFASTVGSR